MADFGEYGGMVGAPVGLRQAEIDKGAAAMNIQHTRLYGAEAGLKEADLREKQRWDALMAGRAAQRMNQMGPPAPGGAPGSLAEPFEDTAMIAMNAGMVDKGMKLAGTASQIRSREATSAAARSRIQLNQLKTLHAKAEMYAGLISGAQSEEDKQRADAAYSLHNGGEPAPFAGMPYSPELVQQATNQALLAKDRIRLEAQQGEYDSRDAFRTAHEEYWDFMRGIRSRAAQLSADREARLAKGGGKPLGAPDKKEVDSALGMIKGEVFKGVDVKSLDPQELDSLNEGARTIASRAKAIAKENPGLDWTGALTRAFAESKAAGDWQVQSAGVFGRKLNIFSGGGKTPEAPMLLPKSSEGLVKGRYYQGPLGIGQWTGSKFKLIGAPGAKAPVAAPAGVPGEEQDESSPDDEGEE